MDPTLRVHQEAKYKNFVNNSRAEYVAFIGPGVKDKDNVRSYPSEERTGTPDQRLRASIQSYDAFSRGLSPDRTAETDAERTGSVSGLADVPTTESRSPTDQMEDSQRGRPATKDNRRGVRHSRTQTPPVVTSDHHHPPGHRK